MSTTHHTSEPRIVIVGAGLGGLTTARVLQQHGIAASVVDRDAGPRARDQGGSLDLHEETGQLALRHAGLFAQFEAISRPEDQGLKILDRDGVVHLREDAGEDPGDRPEVDRSALRDLLLDAVASPRVRWGAQLVGLRRDPRGVVLEFADGGTTVADLVVGADGAWSRVRPLLSDAAPRYSGISFVETHLGDADRRHAAAAALVGNGKVFALADGQGLIAQRNGDGTIRVYVALRVPEDWARSGAIDVTDPAATRAALLERFAGWDPALRALIAEGEDRLVVRPIHALPVGHRWPRVPGVTLVGDAAHLMSPFAGEGANLALIDGADLARALAGSPDDLEAALATHEQAMFERAEQAAAVSAANLETFFAPGAPRGLVELMEGLLQAGAR